MQATLTWLDLTASDRDKMRRVLDLFKEQGTLDEMGLGSLRDALSDALFPGTSSIQTRLRYVLFIPWLYQRLEARRVRSSDIDRAARAAEVDLIGRLAQNEGARGIIGQRARGSLVRLPSSVYWSALTTWGIFQPQQSQGWYQSRFDALVDGRGVVGRADDPGVIWSRQPHWHPRLPEPPARFPWEASFALTPEEADFLRGRVEERCAGTLLAWLVRNGSDSPSADLWEDPDARARRTAFARPWSWRGGSRCMSRASRCSTTWPWRSAGVSSGLGRGRVDGGVPGRPRRVGRPGG